MMNFDAGTILKAVTRLRQLESWVNNAKESKDVKKTTPMSKNAAKVILTLRIWMRLLRD
jgi:hypothetical protein